MKTFTDVLKETKDKNRQLLLGNGFSQAFDKNIFNYKNLLESANFGNRNEKIKKIFQ
ncbi:hypothetical protein [Pectobacterium aroidearum]